ncbi:TrmH family RNA methyltransferase [Candidatus Berkelbacteria bacterium]|nr:TrmH family RNA methyltransferase [Candidatus Berkelbacteria bacterium]
MIIREPRRLTAILLDIRSLHNVGSMFRTAEGLGFEKIYAVGTTSHPHPEEPWRRDHLALAKTALGAETNVPWEYHAAIIPLMSQLRAAGWTMVSLELTPASQSILGWSIPDGPVALIVGHEVKGIPPEVITASDHLVSLPMHGRKESLNVSVAFGIAAFWLAYHQSSD